MKYIKFIILAISISTLFTGCSYVSDMAEAELTTRASFSADAEYDPATRTITISWDHTDSDDSFVGIEIYRTSEPNREFSDYELVASKYQTSLLNGINHLGDGSIKSCNVDAPNKTDLTIHGIFFYRVGFIHIEEDSNTDSPYPDTIGNYNLYTEIDEISGYAKVVIP